MLRHTHDSQSACELSWTVKQQLRQRMHDPCPKPVDGSVVVARLLQLLRYQDTCRSGRVRDRCLRSGGVLFADGARNAGSRGRALEWRTMDPKPQALLPF